MKYTQHFPRKEKNKGGNGRKIIILWTKGAFFKNDNYLTHDQNEDVKDI